MLTRFLETLYKLTKGGLRGPQGRFLTGTTVVTAAIGIIFLSVASGLDESLDPIKFWGISPFIQT